MLVGTTAKVYTCNNGTQCLPDPNGIYTSLSDCQVNCPPQQGSYNCTDWTSTTGCQPVQGPTGAYATLDDCLTSPCQCDQWIVNWPMYTNNPNYNAGTPWSNFTDGPSNTNAISNQLNNIQNSPAYTSTNVNQNQKAKCREKALQEWLSIAQGGNCYTPNGTCNSSWAVGPGDPYGCVAPALINSSNGANGNNYGCQWFCNVLANKHNALSNTQSPVAMCKHQGAIDFLTNYMTTGVSPYMTSTVSFQAPCPNIPTGPGQGSMC